MYQSIHYQYPDKYYLRDDEKGWEEFNYQPIYFKPDVYGKFTSLKGVKCNPTKKYEKDNPFILEKDINPLTRVLIDRYKDSDDTPSYQNILFLDIECEIAGTLTPELIRNSPTSITSISLYDNKNKKYFCLILDKEEKMSHIKEAEREIMPYKSEKELLNNFIHIWMEIDPTIITGWNSCYFDIPYLYYRISKILGKDQATYLSPIGIIEENLYYPDNPIKIAGVNHLDYMLLFKKYIVKQEPSYKLGDIGEKYVNLGKIEYTGNLDRLFQEDINTFIDYNIRDVEIIVKLDDKLKFLDLTITVCHLCHTPYDQIYLSTSMNDGAILTYLKRLNIVSPNKPTTYNPSLQGAQEEYAGGYLKEPIPGLYEWVIDLDFTSLYPSIIRSLNIGIETLIGRIRNEGKYDNLWGLADMKKRDPYEIITIDTLNENYELIPKEVRLGEVIKFIEENNIIVAASGALFRNDISSVVCDVLTDWFNKRSEYKSLMKKAYKEGNKELGEFYNKRQHAYKIKLNDLYGCYAINSWRYTDGHKIISAAITLTGQRLTQESIKFVNKILNERLKTKDIDYVVTSDTDSLFVQLKEVLIQEGVDLSNKELVIKRILDITTEIQQLANDNLNILVNELFNIDIKEKHYFELKQEVVLERGYFAGKRRYAMYIVNKEGVATEELIMMGLDLMKSNMTPIYKKFGEELLKDIMFGKTKDYIDNKIIQFKNNLHKIPLNNISKPTGVKQIHKYIKTPSNKDNIFSILHKKAPINTKGAIFYNDLLKYNNIENFPAFSEGDKMKYIPLKDNPYKIDVLGFTGKDPKIIEEFLDKYADREKGFNSVLLNKLKSIYEDLGWEFVVLNKNVHKFFKFV